MQRVAVNLSKRCLHRHIKRPKIYRKFSLIRVLEIALRISPTSGELVPVSLGLSADVVFELEAAKYPITKPRSPTRKINSAKPKINFFCTLIPAQRDCHETRVCSTTFYGRRTRVMEIFVTKGHLSQQEISGVHKVIDSELGNKRTSCYTNDN